MADETPKMRVAAVQMEPTIGEVAHNRTIILRKLREAASAGARLVVFPECALTGYGFTDRVEAWDYAEPIPGPSTGKIATACAELKVHAVFGLLEREADRLYNACVLVGPGGVVGSYRKVHLPFLGVDRFANPGDRPFAVHDAGGMRLGMHICYDGGFPEVGRVLTLLGADVLVLPTNWPTHAECAAEHMMATRAMENVVYTMAVNRVGEERGFRFIGRSSIFGPNGERLAFATPDREEILYAEVDPARARRKRQVRVPGLHEIDRIADRRPAFYTPLVEPNGRQ
jgi:predicted amidohydrolase